MSATLNRLTSSTRAACIPLTTPSDRCTRLGVALVHLMPGDAWFSGPGVAVAGIAHLPLEEEPILDHRKPERRASEGGRGALRTTEHPDCARSVAADLLEDVAVIRKGIEEPTPCLDARRLSLDGCTCECGHLNWPRLGGFSSRILAPPGW